MKHTGGAFLALAFLAGCGGQGSGMTQSAATSPPAPMSVDFTTFTKGLLANKSDAAGPVAVTPTEFVFRDDDNPEAFASVLTGP